MNEYRTSDLSLASYLACLGYKVMEIDKTEPKRMVFVFQSDETIVKNIDNYWTDRAMISPQKLFNSMKNLKTRLYS